jgi:23S rRNA (uracil1939-C5)-methyltransferase
MTKENNQKLVFKSVSIIDAGAEGMAVGRVEDQVIFVPFVVPGDVVDVQLIKRRRRYLEGKAVTMVTPSPDRVDPHCSHFGICGGCRWMNMRYEAQLHFKQKQVTESLTRIGKLVTPDVKPILASQQTRYYRNKLDFTFSNHRWLTEEDMRRNEQSFDTNAVGFHVPQFFDKVVDIQECFHMRDPANSIRNCARDFAKSHDLRFYDVRIWEGFLRNLILRNTETGGWMVIMVFRHDDEMIGRMLEHLIHNFPEITSMWYVINDKKNDTLYDLPYHHYYGDRWITERMNAFQPGGRPVEFRIGPASFFQTNPVQAEVLYRVAAGFAAFTGNENVYDLYTGTGTIANYIAPYVRQVIGIETVEAAVEDARMNSDINGISNTLFFAGETEKILTAGFMEQYGRPDVVITDPPRNGMHEKVVRTLLEARAPVIVYVSCNPATQARDIALLESGYTFITCQPVDMFPHTQHVENVALLKLKD